MRGFIHHIDLTVRDPWASAPFYDAVLGFMGYKRWDEDARGIDWEHASSKDRLPSIGIFKAQGPKAGRGRDRHGPLDGPVCLENQAPRGFRLGFDSCENQDIG